MNILFLIIGIIIGSIVVWLIYREKIISESNKIKSEMAATLTSGEERLKSREAELEEIKLSFKHSQDDIEQLQEKLRNETEKRAAAEEKCLRINDLQIQITKKEEIISALQNENTKLKQSLSELNTIISKERQAAEEKLSIIDEAQKKLSDAFKALSAESLKSNNQAFLELAKTALEKFQAGATKDLEVRQNAINEIIKPIQENLEKVNKNIQDLEKARAVAYTSLHEQVKSLSNTQSELKSETSKLVTALRSPTVRGRWGEIQLKRVVEIAGMLNYVDFVEQESLATEEGRLRPDMIIKLPNNKVIVVDAKAPLEGYLNAIENQNDTIKISQMKAYAKNIRDRIYELASKSYWEQFKQQTPDFVLLFLPGEHFFGAALEQDPYLIEEGVKQRVIIATPTTLISLLKAVAYGWKQEQIAESAVKISELGKELYERIFTVAEHLSRLGNNLDKAVENYNSLIGSIETRVLSTGRKFKELGIQTSKEDITVLNPIDINTRKIQSDELNKSEDI